MSVQPITEGLASPALVDEALEGVEKADGVELKSGRQQNTCDCDKMAMQLTLKLKDAKLTNMNIKLQQFSYFCSKHGFWIHNRIHSCHFVIFLAITFHHAIFRVSICCEYSIQLANDISKHKF